MLAVSSESCNANSSERIREIGNPQSKVFAVESDDVTVGVEVVDLKVTRRGFRC
jgi:hypothetical protein